MKNLLSMIMLTAVLMFTTSVFAADAIDTGVETVALGIEGADVAIATGSTGVAAVMGTPGLFIANGMVAPIALTYLVANQVDPWHPLACALFGDDARVGNETSAHCN